MNRTHLYGACAVVGAGAHAALGVSFVPIGPSGPAYYPIALNERGDVLFSVDTDPDPWVYVSVPELIRADGSTVQFPARPGTLSSSPLALGENGEVVVNYRVSGQPPGATEWFSGANTQDGTPLTYAGAWPHAHFQNITLDGTLLGCGTEDEFLNNTDPGLVYAPVAWHPGAGETVLDLPDGAVSGYARFGNPAGGFVGDVADASLHRSYVWWNESGEVTGTLSWDTVSALNGGFGTEVVGVRNDGALMCMINQRLSALHDDGTVTPISDVLTDRGFTDVNAAGAAVGSRWVSEGGSSISEPVLWTPDGQSIDLQSLLPGDSEWWIRDAVDITESGDILVHALLREDTSIGQAFIIHGIPTPGAGAVALGIGAMVVVVRPVRKRSM